MGGVERPEEGAGEGSRSQRPQCSSPLPARWVHVRSPQSTDGSGGEWKSYGPEQGTAGEGAKKPVGEVISVGASVSGPPWPSEGLKGHIYFLGHHPPQAMRFRQRGLKEEAVPTLASPEAMVLAVTPPPTAQGPHVCCHSRSHTRGSNPGRRQPEVRQVFCHSLPLPRPHSACCL